MLKNVKNVIAKIKSSTKRNLAILFCFLLCTPIAFADLGGLKDKVNNELKSTGQSILDILKTVVATIGVIYVIIIIHCEAISKQEAINKAKRTRTFAVDIVKNELDLLVQELQSDRENIIKVSLSIMIISKSTCIC